MKDLKAHLESLKEERTQKHKSLMEAKGREDLAKIDQNNIKLKLVSLDRQIALLREFPHKQS
jgi:hypothetical protein